LAQKSLIVHASRLMKQQAKAVPLQASQISEDFDALFKKL
jgi:hypothetical protein